MSITAITVRVLAAELLGALAVAVVPSGWPAITACVAITVMVVGWWAGVPFTRWVRLWLAWAWRRRRDLTPGDVKVVDVDGVGVIR